MRVEHETVTELLVEGMSSEGTGHLGVQVCLGT